MVYFENLSRIRPRPDHAGQRSTCTFRPFALPARRISSPGGNPPAATGTRVDACCAPSRAQLTELKRRTRLSELDANLHCSIIGTCLTTHELRRLVPKYTDLDRQHATDLDIHHAAVELAIDGTAGAKALHKALDERYAGAIRAFDSAQDADDLLARWKEALKNGDVPPAYWALMTHPRTTMAVRQAAFGDLHMLSHLVGAANRADIRRLVVLEENAALHAKIDRQQARLQEMSAQRDAALQERDALVARLNAGRRRHEAHCATKSTNCAKHWPRAMNDSRCTRAAARRPSSGSPRNRRAHARCARGSTT